MDQFLYTMEDAVAYLKSCCKNSIGLIPRTFGSFYCGITNDLETRASQHNAQLLGWVNAKTFEQAKKLEARMHDEGFDTGEQLGHGIEDSIYVYVYKKSNATIE